MKVNEIVPGLVIRGQLNKEWSRDRMLEELAAINVTAVLAVNHRGVRQLDGIAFDSVRYVHWPMADGADVPDGVEHLGIYVAHHTTHRPGRVLVMCNAGRNRTGLVTCLALRHILGINGAQALEFLRGKRPGAVANAAFERFLVRLPCPSEEVR